MGRPDPFGAAARAFVDAAKQTGKPVTWTERQVRERLLRRKEDEEGDAPAPEPTDSVLRDRMGDLLSRSLEQTAAASTEDLYSSLLDQLVPDEARILSGLSDGSAATILHVHERQKTGGMGKTVLENASLIGRTANLTLPHLTPTYVGHLLALGLVTIGPEDPELKTEYEILAADDDVRKALTTAAFGPMPGRLVKRTLRLSTLGREFWSACSAAASG